MRGVLVALVLALPLTACGLAGGPVSGRVLAEGTNQPIAGAIVVVKWEGHTGMFAHGSGVCYHVESTRSGKNGEFRVPSWIDRKGFGVSPRGYRVIAYAPGYAWSHQEPPSEEVVLLAPFKGTVEERFDYLRSVVSSTSCVSAGASVRNLYWITLALYEEAKTIAVSADHVTQADHFLYLAQETLVNGSKPTKRDEKGHFVNVDPRDSYRAEPLR